MNSFALLKRIGFAAVVLTGLLGGAGFVSAADIILEAKPAENRVNVLLDTQGTALNAIQGDIALMGSFDSVRISTSNSIVPLWVDAPRAADGVIHFSGVIPGGFGGLLLPDVPEAKPGLLFSLIIAPAEHQRVTVNARHVTAYLNDGQGTAMALPLARLDFSAGPLPPANALDLASPGTFFPAIGRDSSVFEGRWFVAWNALDRGSGIGHYEVREQRPGKEGDWIAAASPYILQDQELKSVIEVKAIDTLGNQRIARLEPSHALSWGDRVSKRGILTASLTLALIAALVWRAKRTRMPQ